MNGRKLDPDTWPDGVRTGIAGALVMALAWVLKPGEKRRTVVDTLQAFAEAGNRMERKSRKKPARRRPRKDPE